MTGATISTYSLQVLSPESEPEDAAYRLSEADKRVLADLPAMLEHTEEFLGIFLPEGYKVRIVEWDHA